MKPLLTLSLSILLFTLAQAQTTDSLDTDTTNTSCIELTNTKLYYKPNLKPYYRAKDTNTNGEVSLLQGFLHDNNYTTLEPTGYFGSGTRNAVKKFQVQVGIASSLTKATGNVGTLTREKIKEISCSETQEQDSATVSTLQQGTQVGIQSPQPQSPILDKTAIVALCKPEDGYTCEVAPVSLNNVVQKCYPNSEYSSICEKKIPFMVEYSNKQYTFSMKPKIIHVHPLMFPVGGYINLTSSSDYILNAQVHSQDAGGLNGMGGRTMVISDKPGSMTPVYGVRLCDVSVYRLGATIDVSFDESQKNKACFLQKGKQYYVNIKADNTIKDREYLFIVKTGLKKATSPTITPVSSTCGAPDGYICNVNPKDQYTSTILNPVLAAQRLFTAPSNSVNVHPVIFPSSVYNGMEIVTFLFQQATANVQQRDIALSETPGSMTPIESCRAKPSAFSQEMNLLFTNNPVPIGYNKNHICHVSFDKQYYLNVRGVYKEKPVDYFMNNMLKGPGIDHIALGKRVIEDKNFRDITEGKTSVGVTNTSVINNNTTDQSNISSCPKEYPYKETNGKCYTWTGGTCANSCLSTGNCLRSSYTEDGSCTCSYPVDFSPEYRVKCGGSTVKKYQQCGTQSCEGNVTNEVAQNQEVKVTIPSQACEAPAGLTCSVSPISISRNKTTYNVNSYTQNEFQLSAGQVHVHPIIFLSNFYSGDHGSINLNQATINPNIRETVISLIPGSMTPVNPYCKKSLTSFAQKIDITFIGEEGACQLKKGVQYFLNVRATKLDMSVNYLVNQAPVW